MISLVLFLFIFMAVLQTSLLAIDSDTRNMLRNEAIRIAAQSMNGTRYWANAAPANMTTPTPNGPSTSGHTCQLPNGAIQNSVAFNVKFRNFTENFCVSNTVANISPNDNQVIVTVQWQWKGQTYQHAIQSVVASTTGN